MDEFGLAGNLNRLCNRSLESLDMELIYRVIEG